jgi:ATPase family protein associated with various cellular activities (AAA)
MTNQTRSMQVAADVAALLRARNPLLWIVTREEARVESFLCESASSAGFVPRFWDVGQGVTNLAGNAEREIGSLDPGETLDAIRERTKGAERGLWVMRDLPVWLQGPPGASVQRKVRNLARQLPGVKRESAQALIVISPDGNVPPELAGHATVIEWPLPDRAEIAAILDGLVEQYSLNLNGQRDAAIDAAVGLTGEEAQACYSKSLVQTRTIDPVAVAAEKKRVIARERVLEWHDPLPGGLAAVGGLENLKQWLLARSAAWSPEAREYGLPSPKGALLVGVSGCGKSLTAKAIATAYGVPLLRLDLGSLQSKYVGESQGNLRKALKVIEAIGRCVVWLDEIEKALAGATQGAADGGVSADALGTILTWMQERQGEAFIFATCNSVEKLPSELLRKGRFDEIWWIDLPNQIEREAIVAATLRKFKRDKVEIDRKRVAEACDTFTGSEVAEIVPEAMFAAYGDGKREITTDDLIEAAGNVVPLNKTAGDKIAALRAWAVGKARPATLNVDIPAERRKSVRVLDIG